MTVNNHRQALVNKTLHYFNVDGWNCAESVYIAIFQDYYGLNITPKPASAYGGGIARAGSICGAVNVAIMGISQKYGRDSPKQPFIRTQRPVFEFLNKILDEYGSLQCSHIKKTQATKLEKSQTTQENPCTPLIRRVIETFLTLIENHEQI